MIYRLPCSYRMHGLMNRPLIDLALPIPKEALMPIGVALVASRLGSILF